MSSGLNKVGDVASSVAANTNGMGGVFGDINKFANKVKNGVNKAKSGVAKVKKHARAAHQAADKVLGDERIGKTIDSGLKMAKQARDLFGKRLAKDTNKLAKAEKSGNKPKVKKYTQKVPKEEGKKKKSQFFFKKKKKIKGQEGWQAVKAGG